MQKIDAGWQPDLVLIDDDELIQAAWKISAESKGHRIVCFKNIREFESTEIPTNIPIYIDYHLEDNRTGIDVAKKLHQDGYEKLFITTGSAKKDIVGSPLITKVLDKEYPF